MKEVLVPDFSFSPVFFFQLLLLFSPGFLLVKMNRKINGKKEKKNRIRAKEGRRENL